MASFCPLCKKITVTEFRPFCSKRCADLDLAHWLRGDYFIPGKEEDAATDVQENEEES